MAIQSKIVAESRNAKGSTAARRMRREGMLPGVLNNEKRESVLLSLNEHDFAMMLHAHRSEHVVVDLVIDGEKSRLALLKEVQHDPLSGKPVHAEFLEVSMTKKMRVDIPVVLVGDPVGVLTGGGMLEHLLRSVTVDCLPTDLVESIEVDVSGLNVGDVLSVKDIKLDGKLSIHSDPSLAVAAVAAPVAETDETAAAGEEGAAVQPEVIGEKEREERAKEKQKTEG